MKLGRVFGLGLGLVAACAATSRSDLEPRYVAVHNALAAMGLAEVGPLQRGSLAEGRETRFAVDLGEGCSTIVAIGGAGVQDLSVRVLDADDKLVVEDATHDPEAAVKVCPPHAGRYSLAVKMARGAGDFTVATWSGGPSPAASVAANAEPTGDGSCDAPFLLTAGTITGNTRRGQANHTSKNCGSSDAKELVYKLVLTKQERVTIDVDPTFDSILYLRKDDCEDVEAEIACNDDVAPNKGARPGNNPLHASRLDEMLEAGTYFVVVDGYQEQGGPFRMTVGIADVPTLADVCRDAKPLSSPEQGTLTNEFDVVEGGCGLGKGPERPYTLNVPSKARARIVVHSEDFEPVVHVRRTCVDDASEVACTDRGANASKHDAAALAVLDAGRYTVFADSAEKDAHGRFRVDVDLTPDGGRGTRGDACGDAIAVTAGTTTGDTFDAKDDFAPKCAAPGGADVVYRLDVAAKSRVRARFESEEGPHVVALMQTCTDRSSELACGASFDEVLAPGTYWLVVDGTDRAPFGAFGLHLDVKDASLQEAACKAPPTIVLGQTVTGTTAGAPDRFALSCAGRGGTNTSGDRVYRLVNPVKQHVQLLLTTPGFDGVLALRRACEDPVRMRSLHDVEVACNNDGPDKTHSKIDTLLDPGTYFVVVDGRVGNNEGAFTLTARSTGP